MPAKKKSKKPSYPARGFATTSIPRRNASPPPPVDGAAAAEGAAADEAKDGSLKASEGAAGLEDARKQVEGTWEDTDPVKELADKLGPLWEKEVSKTMKAIAQDQRLAAQLPAFQFTSPGLSKQVLAFARNTATPAASGSLDELPYDKEVLKLGVLQEVLEKLGFAEKVVKDCLTGPESVAKLDLDECLEWLFLRLPEPELHCLGPTAAAENPPPTPALPASPDPSATAPPPPPAAAPVAAETEPGSESELSEVEDDGDVASTLIRQFVKTKLALSSLQRSLNAVQKRLKKTTGAGSASSPSREEEINALSRAVKKLERRMEKRQGKLRTIEADPLFDAGEGEKTFREARAKEDRVAIEKKLAGEPEDEDEVTVLLRGLRKVSLAGSSAEKATAPNGSKEGHAEEDGDEGFFGDLLDAPATTAVNPTTGTSVTILDFALPAHFSGKAPKAALEETVKRIDSKHATVLFQVLKKESTARAVRATISIAWVNKRPVRVFSMPAGVACRDETQAQNYLSLLALFSIDRATGLLNQFPVPFRVLWDELVKEQQDKDETAFRERVKGWISFVEERAARGGEGKMEQNGTGAAAPVISEAKGANGGRRYDYAPQRRSVDAAALQNDIYSRQQTPAYRTMLAQRQTLPIFSFRDAILATIASAQFVVLCAETGSGKSTQVGRFLLEQGMEQGRDVKVWCTEPRRISAISLAQRVSQELGEPKGSCGTKGSLVGYSIRLDSKVSSSSRLVFATTGTVLRMFEGEQEGLEDCTHIIIDEVHERSIESDFLLILLRDLVARRPELKVILMSATVDAEKISSYMGGCPVINVPGRTFPVQPFFLEDVVEMTGYRLDAQSDSMYVSRHKRGWNGGSKFKKAATEDDPPSFEDDDTSEPQSGASTPGVAAYSAATHTTIDVMDHSAINLDLIESLLEQLFFFNANLIPYSAAVLIFMPSLDTIRKLTDQLESHPEIGTNRFLVLPLHSSISNENQGLVFDPPPPGVRKIVIATNIAETGITIPDITAVIDSGKHREMRYDEKRQMSRLVETFIARSNASQRRGRAGRVQEGVCFHLFTKRRHDGSFAEHQQPEMTRLSLQDLALRIKIMKFGGSIEGVLTQALDPPALANIQRAVAALVEAKALTVNEDITPLGRHLAKLPMDVHMGKFLIFACLFGCLDAALTITATLNSKSPFVTPFSKEAQADAAKRGFKTEDSDFLTVYTAYASWRKACANGFEREFEHKNFLSHQNLVMIEDLRSQYFSFLVDIGFVQATGAEKREMTSATYGKSRVRFVRVPEALDEYSGDPKVVMACLAVAMYPKILVNDPSTRGFKTLSNGAPAAIHPSSVNFNRGQRNDVGDAKFIVYGSAMKTKKLYVWDSGRVDESAMYLLCGQPEFSLPAHTFALDKKIRARSDAHSIMALKILRSRFSQFFNATMKAPHKPFTDEQKTLFKLFRAALTDDHKRVEVEQAKKPVSITIKKA